MTLNIGSKSKFDFVAPFDTMNTNTIFEVISISDISEMEQNNLKPFEMIYKPVGLNAADMYLDIKNDIKIVTLKANSGYLYVPMSYIDSNSYVSSGVIYNRRAIIIKICALPKEEDISSLLSNIKALVTSELGVVPVTEEIVASADTLVTIAKDSAFTIDRNALRNAKGNYKTQVMELNEQLIMKTEENEILKCALCTN